MYVFGARRGCLVEAKGTRRKTTGAGRRKGGGRLSARASIGETAELFTLLRRRSLRAAPTCLRLFCLLVTWFTAGWLVLLPLSSGLRAGVTDSTGFVLCVLAAAFP
uniref:Uncharacterized protein n=1 Tax=Setaria viridis TaxID=4556 RepID=A0A4U6VPQ7_SETVI|nr:hypothetical protein SEVIR_2G035050v2 [Setaria viridis]